MTESRRLSRLCRKIELLKGVRANTRIPVIDLLGAHHFLRSWIVAYKLTHIILKMSDLAILGPFWDFLKEHDIEIHSRRQREQLLCDYLHSRHHC